MNVGTKEAPVFPARIEVRQPAIQLPDLELAKELVDPELFRHGNALGYVTHDYSESADQVCQREIS